MRVTVKEAMKVRIEGPREAALGSSVNLVAEGVGSGTLTYAWTKDGKAVGSGRRLRISPVGVGDGGLYRVEMSDGKTVVRGELEMAVKNVPQILVGPATQTIGSGRKGRLFVVARYAGGLAYQWYKNGEKINGATGVQWSVSGDGVSESGDAYTVRVSSATESEVYVEASAKVTKGGSGSGSGTSGGEGVEVEGIGSVERAQWWVYSAQAKGNRWTSGERNEEADRLGYWVVERVEDKGSGETRSGRSAFVWSKETAAWAAADQSVVEVGQTKRREYSDVASRSEGSGLETFVLSGRYEAGGEAALYGAAEQLVGEYEGSWMGDLELSWDGEWTLGVQGEETLEAVTKRLRGELEAIDAAPAGD